MAAPAMRDHMEGIRADRRTWAVRPDRRHPPVVKIHRDRLDPGAALGAESREEFCERRAAAPWRRPHQAPRVVIGDAGQVPVALAVGDLTGPDADKAIQTIADSSCAVLGNDPLWSSGPPCASRLSMSVATVDFGAALTSHTHVSSKARVNRDPDLAHGTDSLRTPHAGHSTRRTWHRMRHRIRPRSRCRQLTCRVS